MASSLLHLLQFTLLLSTISSDLAADRATLLFLSSAIRGRTLRWNRSDRTPCLWEGVLCDNTTNRVTELRLPGDGLSGQLPPNALGNLTQLRALSLRRNSLSGPLPSDLGSCTELRELYLQENQFSGEIPASLFNLNNLLRLNLAGNNFSGALSSGFNNLTQLRILYLEHNQFSGSLPELNSLSQLRKFNVSINRLTGSVPSSLGRFSSSAFLGNWLCGLPLNSCPNEQNELSSGAIAGIIIGSVIGLVFVLGVLFVLWKKYSSGNFFQQVENEMLSPLPPSPVKPQEKEYFSPEPVLVRENHGLKNGLSGTNDGLVFFGNNNVEVFSLEELLRASAEVLGMGIMGTTYKTYLESGGEMVVKRLKNVCVSERKFREKIVELGMLDHENLVPLKAYYYGRGEKLLVYESMPMGSLAAILHGNKVADRASLTWEVRIDIAFGIACGLEYLHGLRPRICHGNIKSSNILLDDYSGACLSEFGLQQLVSFTVNLKMNGYHAPEVMDSCKISQKADVYSFGILLLELLTGKDPTNALNEEGIDLPRWVRSMVQKKWTIDVFDPNLLKYQDNGGQMVRLLHLAIYYTSEYPEKRPSMEEVTKQIKEICGS